MSFFSYPIYDIPSSTEVTQITLRKPTSICINKNQYDEAAATLLSKVLGSVGQDLAASDIHMLSSDTNVKLQSSRESSSDQHLVIIFGFSPKTFSLQIDKSLYQLMPLPDKTLLFSKPLTDLPELPQDKRALWVALKKYFIIK